MLPLLYQTYSALSARMDALSALANNLANANSVGYKSDRSFQEILSYTAQESLPGLGVRGLPGAPITISHGAIDFAPGPVTETNNPLHVALLGQGFLVVQTPQGLRYTRQGNLQTASTGQLQTGDGHPVMGEKGPLLIIGDGPIKIDSSGNISVGGIESGRLKIVDFKDLRQLVKEGLSLFRPQDESQPPIPAAAPNLKQGALEGSNINPVSAMTELMLLQREFEWLQRSIQLSMNDMTLKLIDEVSRP